MQVLQCRENFVQHYFLLNLSQAHLTFTKANNKAIRWHAVKHVILWLFCKRIHETKGQFNTLRLWGSACFVVCAPSILLALHRVCGNSHVITKNTKRTRPKNNCMKIKIYYYCHTAFVIGWFDMLEKFSMNFSEEWLLLLHKNLKSFLFPCLQWFIFSASSSPCP